MDPATLVGILLAFGAVVASILMEGSTVSSVIIPGPMVLVIGATIAVGIAGGTMTDFFGAMRAVPRAFRGKVVSPNVTIDTLVSLAETARSDGLLALEQEAEKADDPFLRSALLNIADGIDEEDLRIMLEDEIATTARASKNSARFFMALGGYAPTVGIIGTVVSLTHVLEKLDTPDTLGPMIASAFVATLWGLLSANFVWFPIGNRLQRLAELETERMTLLCEGVLAIQAGSQPRVLGERLRAMVPHAKPVRSQASAEAA
ncbi:MAG: MotA/TolQ/ExbB proton channel family protein [Leifsonia sp.]